MKMNGLSGLHATSVDTNDGVCIHFTFDGAGKFLLNMTSSEAVHLVEIIGRALHDKGVSVVLSTNSATDQEQHPSLEDIKRKLGTVRDHLSRMASGDANDNLMRAAMFGIVAAVEMTNQIIPVGGVR